MLRMTKNALLAGLLALAASAPAAAQDDPEAGDIRVDLPARKEPVREETPARTRASVGTPGPLRFYGGFNVAVGGDMQVESEQFPLGEIEADLDPTIGLQFGADYVLHRYFSIGGEMRFNWVGYDGGGDRIFLWDLAVKPRGRYAFDNIPLELYGALPLGLTVAGFDGEPEGTAGFNIGLVGGANYWFTKNMAINAEIGWVFHKFGAELGPVEIDHKMNQFLLLCPNFVYAL
jgi:hypothetical protein